GEGDGAVHAVDDVSLSIRRGEIFGVIGYSGAGKSTLVRLVNALETVTSGEVVVDGQVITGLSERRVREVRSRIGMVFQQFNLLSSRTVAGNVAYPLKVAGWSREKRAARVAELLAFVGIARALAAQPTILLADEATSALDPETTREVLALLRRVNAELGITIVVITHEMEVVRSTCHRVAVMEHGRVVETGDVYDVFSAPRADAAQRFVGTALHDRPSRETLARLRERHPGRLVTVGVREGASTGTDLFRLLREHDVDGSVVYGGISEVGERPFGSLTVELDAPEDRIAPFLLALAERADVVDLGTAEHPLDDPRVARLAAAPADEDAPDLTDDDPGDPYGLARDTLFRHGNLGGR
ncbi:MAG: methionine ABC transporter ATP-binding protein, partial [Cellulosimicrobium funkei]